MIKTLLSSTLFWPYGFWCSRREGFASMLTPWGEWLGRPAENDAQFDPPTEVA